MANSPRQPVALVFGTRPEAIKMAPLVLALRHHPQLKPVVILTGQHREMVSQVMDLFDLQADHDLAIMQPRQTLADITQRCLTGLAPLLTQLQPRCLLVQGDTTTAFAAALAAFYQQIPLGHVEAGLRTEQIYDPFPEEANRRLISQLAQFHFAPTAQAVTNLQRSGVLGQIHHTGNTVIDALLHVAATQPPCPVPGLDWSRQRVILATVHRRENWGAPLVRIAQALRAILDRHPDTALLLPLHRNPVVREPLQAGLADHPRAWLIEPLDYAALVGAMQRATLVLTDSGGLQEEAPSLGKPVLVLRETTERPEAISAGTAQLIGTDPDTILATTSQVLASPQVYQAFAQATNPFGDGQAAQRILQILSQHLSPIPASKVGAGQRVDGKD